MINAYSQSVLTVNDVIDIMLSGKSETGVVIKDEAEFGAYNAQYPDRIKLETNFNSVDAAHETFSQTWFMPQKYHSIDVLSYCISRTSSTEEIDRVNMEYKLFEERNLITLLQYFIFLVDTMTENNIIWGVGRGSSVSSYILYLIGIHRINSIKYRLDIREFLK